MNQTSVPRGTIPDASLPSSVMRYVWLTSRHSQLRICLLTAIAAPLSMVPLELQRRIVDIALAEHSIRLLLALTAGYLAVVLLQNGMKFLLNMSKGRVLEDVTRELRYRVLGVPTALSSTSRRDAIDTGTIVSVVAAEAEDVGGFASECLSVPLLQGGTILSIAGYLLWMEPWIAVFSLLIYLPQAIVVPRVQQLINLRIRLKTRLMRRLSRNATDNANGSAKAPDMVRRRLQDLVEAVYTTRMKIYARKFFVTFFGNVMDALGPIIVLLVGGYLVISGQAEVGTLVVFISGFQRLTGPWDELVNYYRTAANAQVAYDLLVDSLGRR
jgi:ABC-type bacteriocin/lantibiotic exporter with double-glycine peptidase domain